MKEDRRSMRALMDEVAAGFPGVAKTGPFRSNVTLYFELDMQKVESAWNPRRVQRVRVDHHGINLRMRFEWCGYDIAYTYKEVMLSQHDVAHAVIESIREP